MNKRARISPVILLGLCMTQTATLAAGRSPLESPVVQSSIPGPGEAVARMAAREQADQQTQQPLLFDVADESSREIEMTGQDPIPPGLIGLQEPPESELPSSGESEPQLPIAEPAADPREVITPDVTSTQTPASHEQWTEPAAVPLPPVAATGKSESSVSQRLALLAQRRVRGEISGDAYLAERRSIIYGAAAVPPPAKANRPTQLTVEQKLAALKQARLRGEISGDAYLAKRARIINGG